MHQAFLPKFLGRPGFLPTPLTAGLTDAGREGIIVVSRGRQPCKRRDHGGRRSYGRTQAVRGFIRSTPQVKRGQTIVEDV